jgi:hypothetical protein
MDIPREGFSSRRALLAILLAGGALLAAAPVPAQWSPGGVPIATTPAKPSFVRVMPDGSGGIYIGIRDNRDANTSYDLYLQHLDGDGVRYPGFPASGLPVSIMPGSQGPGGLAPDGAGGILIFWGDYRPSPTATDIYVQRVNPDGTLPPGWAVDGMPATHDPDAQFNSEMYFPGVASDGAGGVYLAWDDFRQDPDDLRQDVFVQRLLANGSVAPGWPADGRAACLAPLARSGSAVLLDDTGGMVVVMGDSRRGNPSYGDVDIYAQRFTPDGQLAPGWPAEGKLLVGGFAALRGVVPDDAGGFYVARTKHSNATGYDTNELFVHRFTFDGERAPGWPAEGVLVCGGPDGRDDIQVERDGFGGIVLAWSESRPGQTSGTYVARIRPDGTLPPGWPANGLSVTSAAPEPYYDIDPAVTHDGAGGLYVAWTLYVYPNSPTQIQHITAQGTVAPGWPALGHLVATTTNVESDPQLVSDSRGGAIVVWQQDYFSFYATRFAADGPVAVGVALAKSEAAADRVTLEWRTSEPTSFAATLERSEAEGEWRALATLSPDGEGTLRYEDRHIVPGHRYGYRLAWTEGGARATSEEVWLETPGALELALHGFTPNPSPAAASVAFTLAGPGAARLELLDIAGRRVASREVGTLGAGRHTLRLDEHGPLAPGLYLLRLTTPGRVLTARGVVIR